MIRECVKEVLADPVQFAKEFGTLVLVFAAVLSILFAGGAPVARP